MNIMCQIGNNSPSEAEVADPTEMKCGFQFLTPCDLSDCKRGDAAPTEIRLRRPIRANFLLLRGGKRHSVPSFWENGHQGRGLAIPHRRFALTAKYAAKTGHPGVVEKRTTTVTWQFRCGGGYVIPFFHDSRVS